MIYFGQIEESAPRQAPSMTLPLILLAAAILLIVGVEGYRKRSIRKGAETLKLLRGD